MNAQSSRSHCLTDIFIDIPPQNSTCEYGHKDYTTMGRMTLVDLVYHKTYYIYLKYV